MERDLIEEYLTQLRARLLTSPRQAQLILDEAEDHLRESVAAGLAAGQTELQAQQAAITSFGSVRAVVRAPAAGRHGRVFAAVVDVVLWTWKLAAVYLIATFGIGLAWQLLGRLAIRLIWGATTPIGLEGGHKLQARPVVCASCRHVLPLPSITPSSFYPTTFVWLGAGAVGFALLGGFTLIRRWQQRSGRVRPLLHGSYSPMLGAIVFFILGALMVHARARLGAPWDSLPDAGVAVIAAVVSAVGYLIALGRALHRRQRPVVVSV